MGGVEFAIAEVGVGVAHFQHVRVKRLTGLAFGGTLPLHHGVRIAGESQPIRPQLQPEHVAFGRLEGDTAQLTALRKEAGVLAERRDR